MTELAVQDERLPEQVEQALQRGETIEAIKLLSRSSGLGLVESKAIIDARLRLGGQHLHDGELSTEELAALREGNKILAVKLLRQRRGLSLKQAVDVIEGRTARAGTRRTSSTVERPRSGGMPWWLLFVIACGWVAYRLLRHH